MAVGAAVATVGVAGTAEAEVAGEDAALIAVKGRARLRTVWRVEVEEARVAETGVAVAEEASVAVDVGETMEAGGGTMTDMMSQDAGAAHTEQAGLDRALTCCCKCRDGG